MRGNIETIKYTSFFSILFALLTYIITLNMEIGFFQPNLSWMSNNFALTVCGGVFASFLVVTLCEVQKYISNKSSCENFLFTQMMYLYIALYLMGKNIDEYIANKNEPVPDNLIDERIMMVSSCVMALRSVDYVTFYKSNKLVTAYKNFCSNKLANIDSITGSGNYLKMAIIKTQIDNVNKTYSRGIVTSADELVGQMLVTLKNRIAPMLDDVSDYLGIIDKNCNNRYAWEGQKAKIHESYISIFKAGRFEDFLKNEEAKP